MMIAGIGCRRDTTPEEIEAVIAMALERLGLPRGQLDALATLADKAAEPGIQDAARRLALPLIACTAEDMGGVLDRIATLSENAAAAIGLPSVAEAAALVAAGAGSRLRGPRVATARATCAIAEGEGL
jgi:cobalt-precorrin 5A hydrolase